MDIRKRIRRSSDAFACIQGIIPLLVARWAFLMLTALAATAFSSAVALAAVDVHEVESEYQNGAHQIRVLLPDSYNERNKYSVLYVLPVDKDFDSKYGRALDVLEEMNAQNDYNIIIVQMGFEIDPWFGDHATDPKRRQASYLIQFVVPFIEKRYSTLGTPEGRLLFGFSKSGWGAFSLILAYPDFFGYAASWDAPLLLSRFDSGMEQVYGTPEQLAKYRPDLLIPKQRQYFQKKTRLVLTGELKFGIDILPPGYDSHTYETHLLLEKNKIRHIYDPDLITPHRWDKAWMAPALKHLMSLKGPRGG